LTEAARPTFAISRRYRRDCRRRLAVSIQRAVLDNRVLLVITDDLLMTSAEDAIVGTTSTDGESLAIVWRLLTAPEHKSYCFILFGTFANRWTEVVWSSYSHNKSALRRTRPGGRNKVLGRKANQVNGERRAEGDGLFYSPCGGSAVISDVANRTLMRTLNRTSVKIVLSLVFCIFTGYSVQYLLRHYVNAPR